MADAETHARTALHTSRSHRWALAATLAISLALNLCSIWWGLPTKHDSGWAPDEIRPHVVAGAWTEGFSGGWHNKYPPTHYYILAIVHRTYCGADAMEDPDERTYRVLALLSRTVSVVMGTGICLLVYLCAGKVLGSTAGLWASMLTCTILPLVFYSKTANVDVPSTFWFFVSLYFLLLIRERSRLRDYIGFVIAGTASVCTKDTAYGLYVLPAIALIVHEYRRSDGSLPRRAVASILNRRILISAVVAILCFMLLQNMFFNIDGFWGHVARISGPGKTKSVAFENTIAGHLSGFLQSLRNIRFSLGWPSLLLSITGCALIVTGHIRRGFVLWIVMPALSSYIFFVSILRTNFDRHLFPMSITLAMLGGGAASFLWHHRSGSLRLAARLVLPIVLLHNVLYAASLDYLMAKDSRYAVRDWIDAVVGRSRGVYEFGPELYLPGYRNLKQGDTTLAEIRELRPDAFIMNAAEIRTIAEKEVFGMLESGELGCGLVKTFHTELFLNLIDFRGVTSNIASVNPPLLVYANEKTREAAARQPARSHEAR